MLILGGYYLAIKAVFLFGLVHSFVKFETLQKSWFFIALIYAAGVTLLSYIWVVLPGLYELERWKWWVAENAVLSIVYFKLLERFDEGWIFWTLILLGLGVVWF